MNFLFFNLLVNSIFSLLAGWLVVIFFLWLFRVNTGPWKLFLLSLPFVKIVYDCVRGIPQNSILHSNVDTFSMPAKHHVLRANVGVSEWGPSFNLQFSVKDLQGKEHAESMGDYLLLWLNRTFGPEMPFLAVCLAASIAGIFLVRRLWQAWQFERTRRKDRIVARPFRTLSLKFRKVDIYISSHFTGTPFTGGIFRPYICIPSSAHANLTAEELEAVIAHELGHVCQLDLLSTIALQTLGDLFWFVPGYRWLSRKIDRMREIVADQSAVRSGTNPLLLASALVKLKEIPSTENFILYSAFFREKSLLKTRVQNLLGEQTEKNPRFGWQNKWARLLITAWIFIAVMVSTFGGNHRTDNLKNAEWFDHILKKWRIEIT